MTGAVSVGWLQAVTGDAEVSERLSETNQIADMLRVEAAYARALGQVGQVPEDLAEAAARAIEAAEIDRDRLALDAAADGMPVPSLSRQLREIVPKELQVAVHTGLTSQDVMDTALVFALRELLDLFETRILGLEASLADLKARFGAAPLMGRTRMQAALPITAGHRIGGWAQPFGAHRARLGQLGNRLLVLQLGGPVGTRESFAGRGEAIAAEMAQELGLRTADHAWHTDRSALAELAGWLSMLSGSLGKMGHDLTLMVQQGVDAARIGGGGTSSAMAHKVNPVRAETLMTLARFNAAQVAGMHLAMDHEQERSGVAWTLEWLLLPRMLEATGAGLRLALALLSDIEHLGEPGSAP